MNGKFSRRDVLMGAFGLAATGLSRPAQAEHKHQQTQDPVLPPAEPDEGDVGRLNYPWAAGQSRARVVNGDNDPFVIEIEERIKCNCGCAHSLYACRTTDFSCQFWQPLHAGVVAMAEQGNPADEIVNAYISEHGSEFLMAPPPQGFNIAGYVLPGIIISSVAAGMMWTLRRREMLAVEVPIPVDDGFADEERDRLALALKDLEA
jgi:cytochrome c-type biogenesis protein CcmH/NrfF